MSNSSQPKDLIDSFTISDNILVDIGGTGANMSDVTVGTIILPSSESMHNYVYDYGSNVSITTGSGGGGTYTIGPLTSDTITIGELNFDSRIEWQNNFPNWARVQDMIEKYPGLKIAFENFKVFYEMVKDDYDNPAPKK